MKALYFFTLFTVLLSCNPGRKNNSSLSNEKVYADQIESDTALIKIEALNLSEDMSSVSTNNDELFLLIYNYRDSLPLDAPVFKRSFVLDTLTTNITLPTTSFKNFHNEIIIFLIEQDTEKSLDELDTILRNSHLEINSLFQKHDLKNIEKYLQDDDVLGVDILKNFKSKKVHILDLKGIIRADRYDYKITLIRN